MSLYEVQEWCICGGWTNTWSDVDGATRFNDEQSAQAELEYFFQEMQEEFDEGNLPDVPDREDFRIVEVNDERNE